METQFNSQKTKIKRTKYAKQLFSTHWGWATQDSYLRDGKQMRWVLWSPQLTALRQFPGHSAEWENPGEAWPTPWVEEMERRVLKTPWLEFTGQHTGTELQREKTPGICKEYCLSRVFNRVLISACTWWNYLRVGKKPAEQIRGNSTPRALGALHWAYSQADWKTS